MHLFFPRGSITSVNQLVQSLLPPRCPSSQSLPSWDTTSAWVWTPWLINCFRAGFTLSSLTSSNVSPRNGKIYFQNHKSNYSVLHVDYDQLPLLPQPHFNPEVILCSDMSALLAENSIPSHAFQFLIPIWFLGISFLPSSAESLKTGCSHPLFFKIHWLHSSHPTPLPCVEWFWEL